VIINALTGIGRRDTIIGIRQCERVRGLRIINFLFVLHESGDFFLQSLS
jgi:hypothetical protein